MESTANIRDEPKVGMRGELLGGLASSIPGFVYALTLGIAVYAPLGTEHADLGIRAGFAAAVCGGMASIAASRIAVPAFGPRASVALVLAAFVFSLTQDPALGVEHIAALAAACVLCAGIIQILFGAMGFGIIAQFVPYPVVAGFMGGIAALIVIGQLPALGVKLGPEWPGTVTVRALPLCIGIATTATIGAIAYYRPHWPALLCGMLAGIGAHAIVAAIAGEAAAGPRVGGLPDVLLPHWASLQALTSPESASHLGELLTAALVIAIIGSLDTLLAAVAIDATTGTRHRPNRELVAQGVGNVVSGLFAGIPVALSAARAIGAYRAGGRSWAVGVIAALLIGLVAHTSAPLLERVPLAVLAGVMLTIAWALVDEWTRTSLRRLAAGGRSRELQWSAAVMFIVAAVTVLANFIVAVIAGVFLSMGLFIAAMNRSLVRAVYPGNLRPSRRIYGAETTLRLDEVRRQIRVVELGGALFFGSTGQLARKLEALAPVARCVVLDLSRLSTIDATGAVALDQLARRASRGSTRLLLVATPRERAMLFATGALPHIANARWFDDADQAIEHAEHALLGPIGQDREIPLANLSLAQGLGPDEVEALGRALTRIEMTAGETLFREGDAGDRLYVLARGAVAILIVGATDAQRRLVTFAPGAMFGEAAMLDGRARSATATVIEDAVLYTLSRKKLEAMAQTSPHTALKLLTNVGSQLSSHLRYTTNTLCEAWDLRR